MTHRPVVVDGQTLARDNVPAVGDVRVLGVHIAAGVVWIAGVSASRKFVEDRVDRLEGAGTGLDDGQTLAELIESMEGLITRLGPAVIALRSAGSSSNRQPQADLLRRGRVEGALMIAASNSSCPLVEVTIPAMAKAIGASKTSKGVIAEALVALVPEHPANWANRGVAFGAGLAALEEAEIR
jgi:hypothetical protein